VSAAAAQTEIPVLLQLYRFLGQAHYYWMHGLFKENLDAVRAGLDLARTTGVHVWDHQLLFSGLIGTLSSGNLVIAEELLEQLRQKHSNWSVYHGMASWHAFLCGDLALARTHGEAALQASEKEGRPYFEAMRHVEMSHVYHRLGEFDKARYHRKQFMSIARGIGSSNIVFPSLLAEAQFALEEGEPEKALVRLREGLALGREENVTNHAWWQPKVMSRLCVEALKAGIEVDYVRKLIRTRNLIPESPPLDIENWPWAIRVVTLGRFEVQKDDYAIAFSRKAPKKPITLLKALIALGGQDVPERKLADTLWPDQEGDTAHETLNVNLHRLRKLLEDVEAIQLQEGKLSLDPRQAWVDAWAFEKSLEAADAVSGDDQVRLIERALKLYRGAFLPEETEEAWSVSYRERLRAKFIRHSAQLGAHWAQTGELELAVNCYLRGLEADDLAEELYQGVIRCYKQMNRCAEALAVYRRMRQTLSVILGVKPSPASEALYRSLSTE
jgi:DNA-binding SARP family transcriptional activator